MTLGNISQFDLVLTALETVAISDKYELGGDYYYDIYVLHADPTQPIYRITIDYTNEYDSIVKAFKATIGEKIGEFINCLAIFENPEIGKVDVILNDYNAYINTVVQNRDKFYSDILDICQDKDIVSLEY